MSELEELRAENERLRNQITTAIAYIRDPVVDRGERLNLAELALESRPETDEESHRA